MSDSLGGRLINDVLQGRELGEQEKILQLLFFSLNIFPKDNEIGLRKKFYNLNIQDLSKDWSVGGLSPYQLCCLLEK